MNTRSVELVDATTGRGSVRVTTRHGARTGLLDPEGNRLFIAVPAGKSVAAIWELSFKAPPSQQTR